MSQQLFDFDAEFRLGIEEIDAEHSKLVGMLNEVHTLLSQGKRAEARTYFSQALGLYVNEHFSHEEAFMERIGFPQLEEHRKIHENFKKAFQDQQPLIESQDDTAFRYALTDAYTWIITHIGKTDRKYAKFYLAATA